MLKDWIIEIGSDESQDRRWYAVLCEVSSDGHKYVLRIHIRKIHYDQFVYLTTVE